MSTLLFVSSLMSGELDILRLSMALSRIGHVRQYK